MREAKDQYQLANLIARVLAGSWRQFPTPLELSQRDLDFVTPSLLQSGAAALAWSRLRLSHSSSEQEPSELQQAYRLYALQALRNERDLGRVIALLRSIDVESILVKGWAVARHYSESGLRPYGDIDFCVAPKDYERARAILKSDEGRYYNVDLHHGFARLDDHSWEELESRSLKLNVGEANVRILCPEDHLRVLCFHFLREGAWRPLWLCDIALALESRSTDFDWERCLGKDRKRRRWFACVLVLAHLLLSANLENVPDDVAKQQLPHWFLPCVLKEWEAPSMPRRHLTPMTTAWRRPMQALKGLRFHWPNAIEGTIGAKGSFNELPRLPFQLSSCFFRALDLFRKLPETFD
jgi:hypothetical protein